MRTVAEREYKLSLFPLVIPVIKGTKELATWRFTNTVTEKDVQFYAIAGRSKSGKHVRVIIKRTGDGQFNFHSIMPDSQTDRIEKRKAAVVVA
jgi:hypothetical protein